MLLTILRQHKAKHLGNTLFGVADEQAAIQLTQALYAEHPRLDPASGHDRVFFREEAAAKVVLIQEIIEEWINKQGHDKCWFYPEIFRAICVVVGLNGIQLPDITEDEFRGGCNRFTLELFNGDTNPGRGCDDYLPFVQEHSPGEASQS